MSEVHLNGLAPPGLTEMRLEDDSAGPHYQRCGPFTRSTVRYGCTSISLE